MTSRKQPRNSISPAGAPGDPTSCVGAATTSSTCWQMTYQGRLEQLFVHANSWHAARDEFRRFMSQDPKANVDLIDAQDAAQAKKDTDEED